MILLVYMQLNTLAGCHSALYRLDIPCSPAVPVCSNPRPGGAGAADEAEDEAAAGRGLGQHAAPPPGL